MTQKQLTTLCAYWQKRLLLQDWSVTAEFARSDDLGNKQGRCDPILEKRAASIKILDPCDVYGDWIVPYDAEWTLVHELLHLHVEPFWRNKKKIEQEQAINAIATALVAEKRARESAASVSRANQKLSKALGKK